jgi:UDPglucose 6-dehydrogenase
MKLTVVGTGYVGLVTGACFAEMGHNVTCVDIDAAKVDKLKQGWMPIYEPGLKAIVQRSYEEGRLHFTTSLAEAMVETEVIFIAVGTPPGEDGSADLQHVLAVAAQVGDNLSGYAVVVTKSTVPVGTAEKVEAAVTGQLVRRDAEIPFDVVSNPEFLKEGAAVDDFMKPDRIVVGVASERAREVMRELYKDFSRSHDRILFMGVKDAEMTKYAGNSMLATKISFMNEIANLCDRLGVDIENVRLGIGSDSRIGYSFIYPGCGYGGSCFPKDVRALIHTARQADYAPMVLQAVHERNEEQKHVLFRKITDRFGHDLSGLSFALWGLAFKPGTDDIREAPAIVLAGELIAAGAKIKAYDPEAMEATRTELPVEWFEQGLITLVRHQYEALDDVDGLVLVTEWKPFRHPDFHAMKGLMRQLVIFDGRNQYDPVSLKADGFDYCGIGRR